MSQQYVYPVYMGITNDIKEAGQVYAYTGASVRNPHAAATQDMFFVVDQVRSSLSWTLNHKEYRVHLEGRHVRIHGTTNFHPSPALFPRMKNVNNSY